MPVKSFSAVPTNVIKNLNQFFHWVDLQFCLEVQLIHHQILHHSDISVIIIIIIIRWCRVLCVVYVVAITCMRTRDVILLAVAVFCPQHEMMGGNIVLPTSFCYCFVFRGFPSCFTFLRLLLSYLLCVKLQIGFYFTSRCCDHICPSCAPLQFYRGISDSQSQMQSSSETYIMHVTNTSSCVLYSL